MSQVVLMPKDVLGSPVSADVQRVLNLMESFARIVSKFDKYPRICSLASRRKMNQMSSTELRKIEDQYSLWIEWLTSPEVEKEPENIEIICAEKALSFFGLRAHPDFLKTLQNDHIIEIYGDDMVQIYRSLNFLNVTSYSLADISVFEWYHLWDRSQYAIQKTLEDAQKVLDQGLDVLPFTIRNQLIKEVFDVSSGVKKCSDRAMEAEFFNLGALFDREGSSRVPRGFICNSKVTSIFRSQDARKIEFI